MDTSLTVAPVFGSPRLSPDTANTLLVRFALTGDKRLLYGSGVRDRMRKQLAKGETPKGYRAHFLEDGARHLLETVYSLARDFNRTYPWDQISAPDIVDLLQTTKNMYVRRSQLEEGEEED